MGTDIRLYPEQRVDSSWRFAGKMVKNIHYAYDPEYEPLYHPDDLYDIRNYALFAILADVRNEERYQCIAPPRGIPDDVSPEIKSWLAYYRDDALDPGWLTLKELVDFAWHEKRIQIYARVDERVAHLFHPERGFPFNKWPAGIPCSYSTTSQDDPFCNASWTQTYAEAAGAQFMELLATFSQRYGVSDDVRFIFWFTS